MSEDSARMVDDKAQKATEFMDTVEKLAVPLYAECLSDATTKVRDGVFLSGVGLAGIVSGILSTKDGKFDFLGTSLNVSSSSRPLLVALVIVCAYFLVLFSTRSFAEWNIWRLRHQSPIIQLRSLAESIYVAGAERSYELYKAMKSAYSNYYEKVDHDPRSSLISRELLRLLGANSWPILPMTPHTKDTLTLVGASMKRGRIGTKK